MKSEAVLQRCSVKKVFLKIIENSLENICAGVKRVWYRRFPVNLEEISKTSILWKICEHILALNEAMKKMLSCKYIHRKTPVRVSFEAHCRYEGLEFHLKGTKSQILSCKICEVLQSLSFTENYLLLSNYFWLPATFLPCFFSCFISSTSI